MVTKKVVVVGSGPAGYTAAIYASRAKLEPVLFEGFFSGISGGQLMTTTEVENYPGFPDGVMGPELVDLFRKQAIRFGTTCLPEDVVSVDLSKRPFHVKGSTTELMAHALIISTGAMANRLDIPGTRDTELWQKGVSACAVCDGAAPIFRDKLLYVVGGGDSAMEEALFLTHYAHKVCIVHRRDEFRASKFMVERARAHPKIEFLLSSVVVEVLGDKVVTHVKVKDLKTSQETIREAGGLFFAVGHTPNTAFLQGQLPLTPTGYIQVEPGTTRTTVAGVYACGDVQDHVYRQAVTAAGTGCMAAIEAERELQALGLA